MMTERVGVFGGTFDPIHIGHLAAVQDAAHKLELDRVLFVPNRTPPHKQGMRVSPVQDRVAMVRLSIADNPIFQLSLIELEREGPSYTLDTMRQLKERIETQAELYFLTGCDALEALHAWHEPQRLLTEFQVVIMDRPTGQQIDWEEVERHFPEIRRRVRTIHVAQLEVSGDDIRRRVREGEPIRYFVVPAVERYIHDNSLYG